MKSLTLQRIAAVDVFRALTMFLMLFVNDIPGLKTCPLADACQDGRRHDGILRHHLPAFLFCMGMSVSFAIQNRYKRETTPASRSPYLLADSGADCHGTVFTEQRRHRRRSIAPMVFHPDGHRFLPHLGYIPKRKERKDPFTAMKTAGVLLLAFLVIYKDMNGKPFQISWWGILGLIGWTYAVCAGIYLFTRENLRKNAIAWFTWSYCFAVISHSDLIPGEYGSRIIPLPFIPSDWTLHAFGMSGVLTLPCSCSAMPTGNGRDDSSACFVPSA